MECKEVALWTEGTVRELNGCLRYTNWDVFKEDTCTNLDELTHTVISYVTFCEEMIIPRQIYCILIASLGPVNTSILNRKNSLHQGDNTQQKGIPKVGKKGN